MGFGIWETDMGEGVRRREYKGEGRERNREYRKSEITIYWRNGKYRK
jgi:hypothetical protein